MSVGFRRVPPSFIRDPIHYCKALGATLDSGEEKVEPLNPLAPDADSVVVVSVSVGAPGAAVVGRKTRHVVKIVDPSEGSSGVESRTLGVGVGSTETGWLKGSTRLRENVAPTAGLDDTGREAPSCSIDRWSLSHTALSVGSGVGVGVGGPNVTVRHVVYTPVTTKPPVGASGGLGTVGVEIIGPELPLTVGAMEDAGLEIERRLPARKGEERTVTALAVARAEARAPALIMKVLILRE
ncbi:hypothetical protein C8J57DRAFT_1383513 [Mycena rebaudengoi]|nr:hypothetical protein C8J57DRAFT_1383513 [Mycena rebaudengoi]